MGTARRERAKTQAEGTSERRGYDLRKGPLLRGESSRQPWTNLHEVPPRCQGGLQGRFRGTAYGREPSGRDRVVRVELRQERGSHDLRGCRLLQGLDRPARVQESGQNFHL